MKVIIEIERDEGIERVKKAFKGERIIVVKTHKEKKKILEAVFKNYNVKLPKNYSFDREAIHAR